MILAQMLLDHRKQVTSINIHSHVTDYEAKEQIAAYLAKTLDGQAFDKSGLGENAG